MWRSAAEWQIKNAGSDDESNKARNINSNKRDLSPEQREELLRALKARFDGAEGTRRLKLRACNRQLAFRRSHASKAIRSIFSLLLVLATCE